MPAAPGAPVSELLRALGVLVEPPSPAAQPVADALELGALPSAAAHTELFVFRLYPYASVYLGAEGMLGGEARDRIAGFWRALGLTPPDEPDHLTTLLSFYAELATHADAAEPDAAAEPDDGARARFARAREAFLWEHLLSWLPIYLDRLDAVADPFYRRWSALLARALDADAARVPAPAALPLHLRAAPPLDDPRTAGGEALLATLTSPVRCGLILLAGDLHDAARDLGLGARVGERRFVLKSLLAQAPAATLAWLAAFARRQAAAHGRHRQLGAVADFWRRRAEATAALLDQLAAEQRTAEDG